MAGQCRRRVIACKRCSAIWLYNRRVRLGVDDGQRVAVHAEEGRLRRFSATARMSRVVRGCAGAGFCQVAITASVCSMAASLKAISVARTAAGLRDRTSPNATACR